MTSIDQTSNDAYIWTKRQQYANVYIVSVNNKNHIVMSRSHEIYSNQPNDELLGRTGETLFGSPWLRPEPGAVAGLIREGLTEADIYAAAAEKGYEVPAMTRTLADLDACLPYFQRVNDILATTTSPDTTLLFASRDADVLYDDFAICYPGTDSRLLPASMGIWHGMSSLSMSGEYAKPFLAQYGLTKEAIAGEHKFDLIDSGLNGTIGQLLDETVEYNYGVSLRAYGRLSVKLVCARESGIGEQIMDLAENEVPHLQRFGPVLAYLANRIGLHGNTYELVVALQTMPRYHGAYIDLKDLGNGRIVASSRKEDITQDVDGACTDDGNVSLVNPVGAAIVQFRVVQAALERSGQLV